MGTPFAAETEGKLLFLEDVNVKPYQIDRMLRQMILAGKLDGVKGMIFGEMLDCAVSQGSWSRCFCAYLSASRGRSVLGLRSGHVSRANVTLPFGIDAELDLKVW